MERMPSAPPPRTVPMKLTTPPIEVLPRVRLSISRPMSKSPIGTRIISAPRHRREDRNLVAGLQREIPADRAPVDRDAQGAAVLQGLGEARSPRLEPIDQGPGRGQIERLLGLADLGLEPGEIEQLHQGHLGRRAGACNPHAITSLKGRKSTGDPSSTCDTPSPICTNPSDSTIEVNIPAPSRGNFSATQRPPSSRRRRARRYSVRLPFFS